MIEKIVNYDYKYGNVVIFAFYQVLYGILTRWKRVTVYSSTLGKKPICNLFMNALTAQTKRKEFQAISRCLL